MSSASVAGPPPSEQPPTPQCLPPSSQIDSSPTLQRAAKLNAAYEPDPATPQYYRRFDDHVPPYLPQIAQTSRPGFKELSSEEMRHIYQNRSLTEEVGNPAGLTGGRGQRPSSPPSGG